MTKIPIALIFSRLIIGFIILIISFFQISYCKEVMIILLVVGLLTDIFDGIIARKLGVSTQKLRRLDSLIDQAFWICTLAGTYVICSGFFKENYLQFFILIGAETLTYVVSYLKFRKEVSTHAILSKIWTLTILASLIQVIASCHSVVLFNICFYLGVISRMEIVLIFLVLKEWTTDVPSLYHAVLLRQGKVIKRNKYFNG
jgi:phosphatidylglycerophosphate synthase